MKRCINDRYNVKAIRVICNHIGALNCRVFKPVPINTQICQIFVKVHFDTGDTLK